MAETQAPQRDHVPQRDPAQRDPAAVQQVTQRLAAVLAESGWPRMPALVFAALLSSDTGLTSLDLTEALGISPAAVSGAVRFLVDLGLVSRERRAGTRRECYRVQGGMWHDVMERGLRSVSRTEDALRGSLRVLGEGTPAGRRVADALAFYEFYGEQMSGVLEKWDEHNRSLEA